MFLIANVHSRSKIYRASATFDVHSGVHLSMKSEVCIVHFVKKVYTLIFETFKIKILKVVPSIKLRLRINYDSVNSNIQLYD